MIKKVLLCLAVVLIAIQFIRPEKNISNTPSPNSLASHYNVPTDVKMLLDRSCYDCHSNNTRYPWYNNIQPVAWLLSHDVNEGKQHFNFDEFATYNTKRKQHKLEELSEEVKTDEMPMGIYTFIHRDAKLSAKDKLRLTSWADSLKKVIE